MKYRSWQKRPHVVSAEEWPILNHERGLLIDKNIAGKLTQEEQYRLNHLNSVGDRYLDHWFTPQRIRELKELEHAVSRTA
jgi:hypothetical protein